MRSLRLKNFRSFRDTQRVELKPLTILVGTNSSGKSSYLRFFPLLRQTGETTTRSPLLWFGPAVDFGDFSRAASRGTDIISVEFELDLDLTSPRRRPRRPDDVIAATISVDLRGHSGQTYVSSITIRCDTDVASLQLNAADEVVGFTVNDHDILAIYKGKTLHAIPGPFIPSLLVPYAEPGMDRRVLPVNEALAAYLKTLAHNRTKPETLLSEAYWLAYGRPENMLESVRKLALRHMPEPTLEDDRFRKIRALILAKDAGVLLRVAQRTLTAFASGISYLGPFRKNPERFYRQQELAIGQIDPQGENLAMFLRSLRPEQMKELSEFVHEHLGFRVSVEPEGSHVAVLVSDHAERGFNLIDMGYGLSQVLPVLAQCWTTAGGGRGSEREPSTTLLAVEQPELHLHPSHQAKLADMFAAVLQRVRNSRRAMQRELFPDVQPQAFPLRILIETHSEALVNRLGELIEQGTVEPSDISVMLFEKDSASGFTALRESTFTKEGTLQNWPLGFFAP